MTVTKKVFWVILSFLTSFSCLLAFFCINFPLKHKKIIENFSKQNNLSPSLVASVINVESHFNQNAVSTAGACGLMQLMPQTAIWLGLENQNLFNPQTNICLGTKYLAILFEQFKNKTCALAAYNAGPKNVENWLKNKQYSHDGKTLFLIPFKETKNYVQKVLQGEKVYGTIF